ncbi:MAG: translation termination inhibitor protein itt1 [Pleopsidium flavum]|nr:MAG: translation termination inhibitor protein itt1 [Pleopsidium flavum]
MTDDLDSLEDERAIELFSIAAIFPELAIDSTDLFCASIDVPVSPAQPLAIVFPPLTDGAPPPALPTPPSSDAVSSGDSKRGNVGTQTVPTVEVVQDIHHLSHLPPLSLQIQLPSGYPSERPPVFHLSTTSSWLPNVVLEQLKEQGDKLWEDLGRTQVVFDYIDHLQQAAEGGFGLGSLMEVPQDHKILLLNFDSKTKREKFEQETFDCGVCLGPKKGSDCYRMLLCAHVFCVECLQDFYNTCITEGDITNVKCLAPDCGKDAKSVLVAHDTIVARPRKRRRKEDRTLNPSELLQIPLEQETVQRYVKLKRKKKLESDRTTVYCPRQWCQGAARSKKHPKTDDIDDVADSASENEEEPRDYDPNANEDTLPPPSERLAICEDCSFAFCKVCKSGWHGEFARCFPRRRYELTAEEKASEDYMKLHTSPCPTCMAPCQKTMGCNHMICFKCNTHFCYLCSAWLDTNNPYKHFNDVKSSCFMRLWELEGGDGGEDVGLGFGGGPQDGGQVHDVFLPWDEDEHTDTESDEELPLPLVLPAPAPPAGRLQPQRGNADPRRMNAEARNRRRRPAVLGGDGGRAAGERGPPRQGLQRFLQLVENDEEDGWDSDELDDDDHEGAGGNWEIPIR